MRKTDWSAAIKRKQGKVPIRVVSFMVANSIARVKIGEMFLGNWRLLEYYVSEQFIVGGIAPSFLGEDLVLHEFCAHISRFVPKRSPK